MPTCIICNEIYYTSYNMQQTTTSVGNKATTNYWSKLDIAQLLSNINNNNSNNIIKSFYIPF